MSKIIDITNQVFGKLTVIEFVGRKNKHSWFRCKCECGGETVTTSNNLKRGHTVSCGCYNEKMFRAASITHGLTKHPLYRSWIGMRNRCYYKKHNRFQYYGGKGIQVCKEWKDSFITFYEWGITNGWSSGASVDRIDNDKDYRPDNCKFSNVSEQNRNRTSNVNLTIDGVTKIIVEWSEITGVNYGTIRGRLKNGWSHKESVFGKKKINLVVK